MRPKSDRPIQRSRTRVRIRLAFGPAFLLLAMCFVGGHVAAQLPTAASSTGLPSYAAAKSDQIETSIPAPPPAFAENGRAIIEIAKRFSADPSKPETELPKSVEPQLRLEQTQIGNGAELLT